MITSLRDLAFALGGDVGSNYILCPGPGHSAQDRSLRVSFDGDRLRVHSFADDDWRVCLDYVQLRLGVHGLDTSKFEKMLDVQRVVTDREKTMRAWAIWNEAVPIDGTPAELHLILRGLGDVRSAALRWHPACPYGPGGARRGCMVAAISNIITNQFQAMQRTPLATDGERVGDRMILGPSKGGAIKLTGEAMPQLAIGEGVETALSFSKIPGMAGVPIWSTVDANGMTSFPVLPDVRTLWVIADHDKAGKRAADHVSETWANSDRNVFMLMAKHPGLDLNDLLRRARHD